MSAPEALRADLLEEGTVLRLVLDRPKGNVLDQAMMAGLAGALERFREERHLRMVMLRGAGGHFSFGASVEEHQRETVRVMLADFHGLVRSLATYPVPVAALVQGRCLGGAFEVALCAHLVFATPDAVFGCPEIKLGVFPPVLAVAGPARLGAALSERMVLTGATIGAEEARRCGLVAEILDGDDPEAALLDWYRQHLRPLSAWSLRQAVLASRTQSPLTAALGDPLSAAERRYLEQVVPSHDGNEGLEAFLGKRKPVWRDE